MAAHSIASLSLSFGLVSIPVKLYSAPENSSTVRFNMLSADGSRLKQQYVSEKDQKKVERKDMVNGYAFEKDQFVIFTADELKALEEGARHTIDIVSFIPTETVDPLYYDKAYFLAPDKRGGKPYALLMEAIRESGRCALAKWAWKTKQFIVQVRVAQDGLVLQQLLYAEEVRSIKDLGIEPVTVGPSELKLALQLIDQISEAQYDPTQFVDDEKARVLAEIDRKIEGKQIVASEKPDDGTISNVIDLMDALRASLERKPSKERIVGKKAAAVTEIAQRRTGQGTTSPVPARELPAKVDFTGSLSSPATLHRV